MSQPHVSIITLTYNQAKFIAQCVESVLAQTYRDWEMIVIDDGSTDATREIVLSYREPKIGLHAQPHGGTAAIARNYNRALALAHGDVVAILEGDDFWPPSKLASLVPSFRDPSIVLAYGITQIVAADGTPRGELPSQTTRVSLPLACLNNDPIGRAVHPMLLPGGLFVYPCSTVIRKSSLHELGGFVTVGDEHAVDTATFINLALKGKFAFKAEIMGFWRRHANQINSSPRLLDYVMEDIRYLRDFAMRHKLQLGLSSEELRAAEQKWERATISLCWSSGRMLLARRRWEEARQRFRWIMSHSQNMLDRLGASMTFAAATLLADPTTLCARSLRSLKRRACRRFDG